MSAADQGSAPTSPTTAARTAPRRGWLIAALTAAVALLLGSFVAVAAWTGGIGGNAARSDGVGPGTSEFRSGTGGGPGMMGEGRRAERTERRADRLDHMRGWGNS